MPGDRDITGLAWEKRQAWPPSIRFYVPGAKRYRNSFYSNRSSSFVQISITGRECACRCAHCDGKLLQHMIPAASPEEMRRLVDGLVAKGCRGILVSGGAEMSGEVPLLPFRGALGYAKQQGLRVLVHGGVIREKTAAGLKDAGVDQVLLDVIGHEKTIREVYHLPLHPSDYRESMMACRKAGLEIAPHIVIGLHFGQILGEMNALEKIRDLNPETLVLVILSPHRGTEMAGVQPPPLGGVAEILATARVSNPAVPLALGCARPPGDYKHEVESLAVDCGVNAIAYPDEATVSYARSRGLKTEFFEECCSLVGSRFPDSDSLTIGKRKISNSLQRSFL